jgi:hypothetical protein
MKLPIITRVRFRMYRKTIKELYQILKKKMRNYLLNFYKWKDRIIKLKQKIKNYYYSCK